MKTIEIACIGAQRPTVLEALEGRFTVHRAWEADDMIAELARLGGRVRGVASHGMAGLPRAVIEALPNLEICAIMGVGLETTDLPLARERGIIVTTAPVLYDDVADMGMSLALATSRRIVAGDRYVRAGRWLEGRMAPATKFSGKRAGILGLGRIGQAIARRLEGFGMQIGYFDINRRNDLPYTAFDSPIKLAGNSDFLFICAAGSPDNTAFVNGPIFDALGPTGILVNVARGWLVDEPALIEALSSGRLGGAGLDVFADEPNVPEALMALDNVVLMPHQASSTVETVKAMGDLVVENLTAHFEGRPVPTPVPGTVPDGSARVS